MTATSLGVSRSLPKAPAPVIIAGLAFLVCYWHPMVTLGRDWLTDPNAGHGLLLFPVALYFAWKSGVVSEPKPQHALGLAVLAGSVLLRYLSGLAAELFTMRISLLAAVVGVILYLYGTRQLLKWWLPGLLILLSVPLPEVLVGSLALPLQLKASAWGAAMLELRQVPVRLAGNVIQIPGQSLFVTEACSGLRSLTALVALGVLARGLWLKGPWARVVLGLLAVPIAMVLNAVRVFLTGFLSYFVSPSLADGFMHLSEGWVIFVIAFAILTAAALVLAVLERRLTRARAA